MSFHLKLLDTNHPLIFEKSKLRQIEAHALIYLNSHTQPYPPPPTPPGLSTRHDWTLQNAIVIFPNQVEGKLEIHLWKFIEPVGGSEQGFQRCVADVTNGASQITSARQAIETRGKSKCTENILGYVDSVTKENLCYKEKKFGYQHFGIALRTSTLTVPVHKIHFWSITHDILDLGVRDYPLTKTVLFIRIPRLAMARPRPIFQTKKNTLCSSGQFRLIKRKT